MLRPTQVIRGMRITDLSVADDKRYVSLRVDWIRQLVRYIEWLEVVSGVGEDSKTEVPIEE